VPAPLRNSLQALDSIPLCVCLRSDASPSKQILSDISHLLLQEAETKLYDKNIVLLNNSAAKPQQDTLQPNQKYKVLIH